MKKLFRKLKRVGEAVVDFFKTIGYFIQWCINVA